MTAVSLQSGFLRYTSMLFIFLLSHHISADLVVRNSLDIEQYITPRLFSPKEEAFSNRNFTFQLQKRSLAQGQSYDCDIGYVYCKSNGGCCLFSGRCCKDSCTDPGGVCCTDGGSCPAGSSCCDALNLGNHGCAPQHSSCCINSGYCRPGWACCEDSAGGCAPVGGECCSDFGYCTEGNQCVTYLGRPACCFNGICVEDDDNGQVYPSQPPDLGEDADAPTSIEEQRATLTQTDTVQEYTTENLFKSTPVHEPTPTNEVLLRTTRTVELTSTEEVLLRTAPSVDEPTSTEGVLLTSTSSVRSTTLASSTSRSSQLSLSSITAPVITSQTSGVGAVAQTMSRGTPKIRRASWLVIGATFFVRAALKF